MLVSSGGSTNRRVQNHIDIGDVLGHVDFPTDIGILSHVMDDAENLLPARV